MHLFLDAKERSEAGDAAYDLAPSIPTFVRDVQGVADEVLINLTKLLHPERVAAMQASNEHEGDIAEILLYADPDWPESADLTALRLRAGRCRQQIFVPSPPMFRVSWDVLKANAARDGLTWISRRLWSSTGVAGAAGPYLAWARGRHSVKRTLQRIGAQAFNWLGGHGPTMAGTRAAVINAELDRGWVEQTVGQEELSASEPTLIGATALTDEVEDANKLDKAEQYELASRFGLPLSILQDAPDKLG